ncbi:hypothetical protein K474DRAFT_1596889 [Panus rudis PR-1116 ss-1]|nr:hypothetical protein K474DRAFT_1596889 [Panus rudis PR-1116 ss-1]
MPKHSLKSSYHYARLAVIPSCTEALTVRKIIQDALTQTFGVVGGSTYIDVLWVSEDGSEVVIRANKTEIPKVLAAVAAYNGSPSLSVVKESSFLPALLCTTIAP